MCGTGNPARASAEGGHVVTVRAIPVQLGHASRTVTVRPLMGIGIDDVDPCPLLSQDLPCLMLEPPVYGNRKMRDYPVIPLGMAKPETLRELNAILKDMGMPEITPIPHRLHKRGSLTITMTPPLATKRGTDRDGNDIWLIGSQFGFGIFLDSRSTFIPVGADGRPVEVLLAVTSRQESRVFVRVVCAAADYDGTDVPETEAESRYSFQRLELDGLTMLGMTLDEIDPDPERRGEIRSLRKIVARMMNGRGVEAAIAYLTEIGIVKEGEPISTTRTNVIDSLRKVEPEIAALVRDRWVALLDTDWDGYEFPGQTAALAGREAKIWYVRCKKDDLIAPLVAKRLSEVTGEEVAFDPKNPWHRQLRTWIYKRKCARDLAPREPIVPPENEAEENIPTEGSSEE